MYYIFLICHIRGRRDAGLLQVNNFPFTDQGRSLGLCFFCNHLCIFKFLLCFSIIPDNPLGGIRMKRLPSIDFPDLILHLSWPRAELKGVASLFLPTDLPLRPWAECELRFLDIERGPLFDLVLVLLIESAHPLPLHHCHCCLQRLCLPMLPLKYLSRT